MYLLLLSIVEYFVLWVWWKTTATYVLYNT